MRCVRCTRGTRQIPFSRMRFNQLAFRFEDITPKRASQKRERKSKNRKSKIANRKSKVENSKQKVSSAVSQ